MVGSRGMEEILAEIKQLKKNQQHQAEENTALRAENKLLREKVKYLLKKMFGAKSEKLSDDQLMLMLGMQEASIPTDDEPDPDNDPRPSNRKRGNRESKPRLPADLPTEDIVIEPEEVKQNPSGYRKIGEEITEELDVTPTQYFRRRIIRPKYVSRTDKTQAPVIAELPTRIIEGGYASAGLLADIIVKKYADHLPLYRQEQILKSRYGIDLSRQTMCDWVRASADWLSAICRVIKKDLQESDYLQVDETPVKYCSGESGESGKGYFWVFNDPWRKDVLYEWRTGRAASCMDEVLKDFKGTVQCDGYGAYPSYARDKDHIEIACCWAHARRKFYDAKDESPKVAGWFLKHILALYKVEEDLRDENADHERRRSVRENCCRWRLALLHKALRSIQDRHLPSTQMGKAVNYTLARMTELSRYCGNGKLEIDNNLVENAIRPTAVGKKNWLFIGHPNAGDRSAIIYTIIENCKRHGISPHEYIKDMLTRLPSMKNTELNQWTPAAWAQKQGAKAA